MKYVKLFSALAIIMAVAVSSTTGVFAQTDVNADVNADASVTAENTDKQIYKEKAQQIREQIKEQRQDLKSKLTDLQNLRNDRQDTRPEIDVVPSLEFTGKVSGWAVIGGQAVPATFDLSGESGSFALAFHRSAIVNEQAQIRIPLILVGQVDTTPIDDALPPVVDSVDISEDLVLFN